MFSKQSSTLFANPLTIYPFRQYDLIQFAKQQGDKILDKAGECHALVLAFLGNDNSRAALKENNLKQLLPIIRQLSLRLNGAAYREYGSESSEYNTYGLPGLEPRQFKIQVELHDFIALFKMLEFNQDLVLKIGAEKVAPTTLQSPSPTHMLGIKRTSNGVFELFDPNKGVFKGSMKYIAPVLLDLCTYYSAKSTIIGYTTTPLAVSRIAILNNQLFPMHDEFSNAHKITAKL